jgi:hypothetical protein
MRLSSRSVAAFLALLLVVPAALAGKTRNVIFVISDGLRWQEVFSGADPLLLNDQAGGSWTAAKSLDARYGGDDPRTRRAKLFPFLWGTVAREGQLFGNQALGSVARVSNPYFFSYPGYNEMSTGVPDPRIDSNEFGPNPNVTVFEWLAGLPEFRGKVEIFGTWQTFHDIFNDARSHLPVRSGATLVDTTDRTPRGRLLAELYATMTQLEPPDPADALLHVVLRHHLAKHHPRVLFVGYGDTDNWAHSGRYDALLDTAHAFDGFVADLWHEVQSIPAYRDKTTLIVSADHGRGSGLVDWKEHGVEQPGSENIWIAVMGPDTPALGERHDVATVTQAQIAATIAALVGQDYRAYRPEAAPSLLEALGQR